MERISNRRDGKTRNLVQSTTAAGLGDTRGDLSVGSGGVCNNRAIRHGLLRQHEVPVVIHILLPELRNARAVRPDRRGQPALAVVPVDTQYLDKLLFIVNIIPRL